MTLTTVQPLKSAGRFSSRGRLRKLLRNQLQVVLVFVAVVGFVKRVCQDQGCFSYLFLVFGPLKQNQGFFRVLKKTTQR